MAHLIPEVKQQFFDANGDPLAGGKVYSYAAGTSTPLATYTDQTELTQNANPVILDANGEASIWMGSGSYKIIVKDSNDVTLTTKDNVTFIGLNDVATSAIQDSAVTTAKIADGAVTAAKLAAKDVQTQALTIGSITSTTPATQTGTLTIDTTGRPVHVGLIGQDSSGTPAAFKISATEGTEAVAKVDIYREATLILSEKFGIKRSSGNALLFDENVADTYTFTPDRTGTVILVGCGGGGGGGGGPSTSGGGGGGGAGGDCGSRAINVTAGLTYDIVIGAGGAGGSGNGNGPGNTGSTGGVTTFSQNGTVLAKWEGGLGGIGGQGTAGSGGSGGVGRTGGSGGAGGAGSAGTGADGTAGHASIGFSDAGTVQASVPSGGNGGGGGSGGGSIGAGGNGQRNNLTGGTNGTEGGGGGGAAGASSTAQTGFNGGDGVLRIYDASAGSGGTIESTIPVSAFHIIDTGANSATHNYTLKLSVTDANATLIATGIVKLEAYEL